MDGLDHESAAWVAAENVLLGRTPQHVGFLVRDLDQTLRTLSEGVGLKVSAPLLLDLGVSDLDVGEPARIRLGFAMLGIIMAEFIEPRAAAPDVWSRALEERGPGLHHIAFTQVENYGQTVQALTTAGFEVTAGGHFGEDHWCYLELEELVIELTSGEGPARRFGPGVSPSAR